MKHEIRIEPTMPMPMPMPTMPERPARSTRRKPASERVPLGGRRAPPGWYALCVSVPGETITAIDAAIDRIAAAGAVKLSRSRLIRIALERLDLEGLAAELARLR